MPMGRMRLKTRRAGRRDEFNDTWYARTGESASFSDATAKRKTEPQMDTDEHGLNNKNIDLRLNFSI